MAISKVVLNGATKMDTTAVTVTAEDLAAGITALGADGELITGTGGSNWKLLEEKTFSNLSEYTDTSTGETIGTSSINYKNTDYAWLLAIVTCDSAITTSTEWGMSIINFVRYTTNGNLLIGTSLQQKGSATLSRAAMVNSMAQNAYGVAASNNTSFITITRKAHSSGCPKIRGGNYTLRVYGLESL